MASIILSTAGASLFGPLGGFAGAIIGSSIDGYISSELSGRIREPSKLGSLSVQSSQDGAPMPIVYGKAKIAGQIIWASKFRETTIKRKIGSKGGQKVTENIYLISFAIGLCEGEISGIGKVWVNGDEFDLSTTEYRLYRGTSFQEKDPIIEATEGVANTPRFNDIAYIVFEDFNTENYGDRIPQFAFEIYCPTGAASERVENLIKGVCLIPGAGEFVYSTTSLKQLVAPGHDGNINNNASANNSDFIQAIDNLERDLPNVKSISLVVSWFGTDLRVNECEIMPKVDRYDKMTSPQSWYVGSLGREDAILVSNYEGNPSYGGTPSDGSVKEAIKELKARGFKVIFNPFIMMDIPLGNNLPALNGSGFQAAYPWRGRISVMNGIDGTQTARSQISGFYNGRGNSYRNFIIHYANLCAEAGGVDTFLLGSEMIGLTRIRDNNDTFPFVDNLVSLAAEISAILPNTSIGYGADWTEYGAYYHGASGNIYFPLDALWGDGNIDFIGIDYYAPISDRHENDPRYEIEDFKAHIEGGEGYEYYYASPEERKNNLKTPINDSLYQENWVFRQKDIRGFWSNLHYPRINGIKAANPTKWQAKSKPIRLTELGYAAVDRAGNLPSAFPDPKSIENTLPYFSSGARDDMEQRNALSAFLSYWEGDNNPQSDKYNGAMIDLSGIYIWAWDARPYPAFPALTDLWSDAENMLKGHWLMGRMGQGNLGDIIKDICHRCGLLEVDTSGVKGIIDGYIIESPQTARAALEGLIYAFGIEVADSENGLKFFTKTNELVPFVIDDGDVILNNKDNLIARNYETTAKISRMRLSCYGLDADYDIITHEAIGNNDLGGNDLGGKFGNLSLSVVAGRETRAEIARHLLAISSDAAQNMEINIGIDVALRLEIGDIISAKGQIWRVETIEYDALCKLTLSRLVKSGVAPSQGEIAVNFTRYNSYSRPFGIILSLPYPFVTSGNAKVFVAQYPFFGNIELRFEGSTLAQIGKSASYGYLQGELPTSVVSQRLNCDIYIKNIIGELPQSGNLAFIENDMVQDIIYYDDARLVGENLYLLSGLVRGLSGVAIAPKISDGAFALLLDDAGVEVNIDSQYLNISMPYQFTTIGYNDDEGYQKEYILENSGQQLFSPCHINAIRQSDGIHISFIRRAAGNGDGWEVQDVPSPITNRYKLEIYNSETMVRDIEIGTNNYLYTNAMEHEDFGASTNLISLRIAQIDDANLIGKYADITISL